MDLAKAEEEFKAAWDGEVWEKGFYLQLLYNTGNDQRKTFCEILEQNVESLNPKFSVSVVDVPWATYLRGMDAGRLPMFFIGWIQDYHHPHNWVTPYMASTGTFSAWQNIGEEFYSKADALIAEAVKLPPDQAHDKYAELQNLATNEYIIDIFGVQAAGRRWEQLWVKGYYFNPAYFGPWFYRLSKGQ
jgi:peptide/nickel transport system substrate-binding protein